VDYERSESVNRETGRPVIQRRYTLDIFETGRFDIPGPVVKWKPQVDEPAEEEVPPPGEEESGPVENGSEGEFEESKAPDLYVEVVSSLPEGESPEDIRDIAPPVPLIEDLTRKVLLYSAGGLALIALLAAAVMLIMKRKRVEPPPPPPKPAHVRFFLEMERIRALDLPAQGKLKEYVYLVNAALRRYIEDRLNLRAPERTTEEFLPELRDSRELTGAQKDMLRKFLGSCDRVKYARYIPEREEIDEIERWATEFVMQTREHVLPGDEKEIAKTEAEA
jgi:hypothetical protein